MVEKSIGSFITSKYSGIPKASVSTGIKNGQAHLCCFSWSSIFIQGFTDSGIKSCLSGIFLPGTWGKRTGCFGFGGGSAIARRSSSGVFFFG